MSGEPQYTRLSVNINTDTQKEIRRIAALKGWTVTETVRRLVEVGAFVYRQDAKGMEWRYGKRNRRSRKRIVLS